MRRGTTEPARLLQRAWGALPRPPDQRLALRHAPLLALLSAAALLLGACGAGGFGSAEASAGGDFGTGVEQPIPDVVDPPNPGLGDIQVQPPVDAADGHHEGSADADDEASADAGPTDDATEDRPTTAELKDDDTFLVPPGVAARRDVAVAAGRVAWVEIDTPASTPVLRLWDLTTLEPPITLELPYLVEPRSLALSDEWLVYVDGRYGDADVFAVRLSDGAERAVAALPGAQDQPALRGGQVAWRDCRDCVPGLGDAAAEIYRLDLDEPQAAPVQVTQDEVEDRRPTWGSLVDGALALAWIHGDDRLMVLPEGGGAATVVLDRPVLALALDSGHLVWRESISIINPDSMMPIDIYGTNLLTGETGPYSEHAEVAPGVDPKPTAAGGRVAWVESVPGELPLARVRVADSVTGELEQTIELLSIQQAQVSDTTLAIIAPRQDNGGQPDVLVLPLDTP
jgi:hypothetical protein